MSVFDWDPRYRKKKKSVYDLPFFQFRAFKDLAVLEKAKLPKEKSQLVFPKHKTFASLNKQIAIKLLFLQQTPAQPIRQWTPARVETGTAAQHRQV
jgi:hypothetical protein